MRPGASLSLLYDRLLALAAVLVLPPALRVVSLRRMLAFCDRWPTVRGRAAPPAALASRTDRWLAHGRGPWSPSCLTRSVVLYAMLRQHGHAPRLHIGVAGVPTCFVAHAWLTFGDEPPGHAAGAGSGYRELFVHGG